LKAHNFWVLTASNGIEALRILGQAGVSIALVVTDVVMPEMGGISLYQVMRRRWPKIKVMLITGHPLETENKALIEKGNIKWLQKPFSVRDFSNAVQALLMAS
jgi:DNA-binding response OmpR family regulator